MWGSKMTKKDNILKVRGESEDLAAADCYMDRYERFGLGRSESAMYLMWANEHLVRAQRRGYDVDSRFKLWRGLNRVHKIIIRFRYGLSDNLVKVA